MPCKRGRTHVHTFERLLPCVPVSLSSSPGNVEVVCGVQIRAGSVSLLQSTFCGQCLLFVELCFQMSLLVPFSTFGSLTPCRAPHQLQMVAVAQTLTGTKRRER